MANGKTKLIGIIGNPISHSASPEMHNSELERLQLNYLYIPLLVKNEESEIKKAIESIKTYHLRGINVTVPFKENVIKYLDQCDESALKAQAVNTIINENNTLIGYNTDGAGFLLSLKEELQFDLDHKKICILGAGGSSKAIATSLIDTKITQLSIINRTKSKADTLCQQLKKYNKSILYHTSESNTEESIQQLKKADLIIQSTSVGLTENKMPLKHTDWINENQVIIDIIYNPEQTLFLKSCQAKGAKTLNGAGMLAGQGIIAFEKFTGQKASYHAFKEKIYKKGSKNENTI